MTNSTNSLALLEENKQIILREFPKFSNKKINTVFFFYELIKNADDTIAPALFQHFCIVYEDATLSHERDADTIISQEEIKMLEENFDDIIEAKFKTLLKRKYEEKMFYEKLWYFIWKSDVLSDIEEGSISENTDISAEDKVRTYALYEILRDKRIPYFFFPGGLNMSNEDYRAKCDELANTKRKIRFILSAEIFDQKTEKASQLVKIIDELEAYQDKTIAMVFIINELQKNQSRLENVGQLLHLLESSR